MTVEIKRKVSVILAAMVAAVFGLVAFVAPVAQAAEGDEGTSPAQIANIKADAKGSITLTKLSQPEQLGTDAHNGTEVAIPTGAQRIQGVQFKITKLNLDLTKSEDWQKIRDGEGNLAFTPATAVEKIGIDETFGTNGVKTETTDENGQIKLTNLPLGMYLFEEQESTITKPEGAQIVEKAAPFLVTVPLKNPNNSGWMYDINVYPKNSLSEADKKVDDSEALIPGDSILWTVTAAVPSGVEIKNFSVSDTFDDRLTFTKVKSVELVNAEGTALEGDQQLAEGDWSTSSEGQKVTVNITNLDKLNNAPANTSVKVVFDTTINDDADLEGGVISNTAIVNVNNNKFEPSDTTYWGKLVIDKRVKGDESQKLKGAVFGVYETEELAKAGSLNEDGQDPTALKVLTTDENGFASLKLKATADGKTYYLKELKAPAGYVLDSTVRPFTINSGETAELATTTVPVDNEKPDIPDLPITGASGQLLMIVGGLAIVLMGAGVGLVAYKRNRA